MAEQLSVFGEGDFVPRYAPPVETSFSSGQVPQEVIDQTLFTAGNRHGSAFRVAAFFMREYPEEETIAFLRREFGADNGRGIAHEGRKYAVWFQEDGIHLSCGTSVRTGYGQTVVSWETAARRILKLLESGTYLSQSELEQASAAALRSMADGLDLPRRSFTAQPDFQRQCKMCITQDEMEHQFLSEPIERRQAVYSYFCETHSNEERQNFIKDYFGEYSGGVYACPTPKSRPWPAAIP